MYKGIIIEESLSDSLVLKDVKIVKTDVKPVTEKLGRAIDEAHASSWYADLKNDTTHYVIFSHKVFKIDRSRKAEYDAATAYGMSIGIPEYQLDFSSYVTAWAQ